MWFHDCSIQSPEYLALFWPERLDVCARRELRYVCLQVSLVNDDNSCTFFPNVRGSVVHFNNLEISVILFSFFGCTKRKS